MGLLKSPKLLDHTTSIRLLHSYDKQSGHRYCGMNESFGSKALCGRRVLLQTA